MQFHEHHFCYPTVREVRGTSPLLLMGQGEEVGPSPEAPSAAVAEKVGTMATRALIETPRLPQAA